MADDATGSNSVGCTEFPHCCHVCGSTQSLKRCAKCKTIFYCSREHQISDWKNHKVDCKARASHVPTCDLAGVKISSAKQDEAGKGTDEDQQQQHVADEFDNSTFDERPYKTCDFEKPECYEFPELSKHIAKHLKEDGFCVVDGLLSDGELSTIGNEVKTLDKEGRLTMGQLGGGRSSGKNEEKVVNKDIRNDRIMWFQGDETDLTCPAIYELLTEKMDFLVGGLNAHISKKKINGRTKVKAD